MKGDVEGKSTAAESVFGGDEEIKAFQSALIEWFQREGRTYPWRETTDPYAILVSELMLQQTQIATVLGKGYYQRWLERFPDVATLAEAEEPDLLKAWEGLGYYNRARNLRKAAAMVANEFDGRFPEDFEAILSLPGVGRYTAGAVMSFAFNRRAPIVDGNVTRVFARIAGHREPVDNSSSIRFFWDLAEAVTPHHRVREYNSAIMELGQRICTRASPDCGNCPVGSHCEARKTNCTDSIPVKKKRAGTVLREERVGLAARGGEIYLSPEKGSRRRGMWRLPELTEEQLADLAEIFRFDYAITKYKVTLRSFVLTPPLIAAVTANGDGKWFPLYDENALPAMGSPYLKAIRKYQNLHDELNLSS